ncbi:MAG: hypothetical protein WCJ03_11510 [Bacteroidales bacterium]
MRKILYVLFVLLLVFEINSCTPKEDVQILNLPEIVNQHREWKRTGFKRDFHIEDLLYLDSTLYTYLLDIDSSYMKKINKRDYCSHMDEKGFVSLSKRYSSIEQLVYLNDPALKRFMKTNLGRPYMFNKALYHNRKIFMEYGGSKGSRSCAIVIELITPDKLAIQLCYMMND